MLLSRIFDEEVVKNSLVIEATRNDRNDCENINREEVRSALLRRMKYGNAAGLDGITAK